MRMPQWLLDHWIRKYKAQLENLPNARFSIRLARDEKDLEQAFRLVQVSYAYLGIEDLGKQVLRMTEQHLLSEALVLVAHENDRLVGTISLTLDSPAGLPLDDDYPDELDRLRNRGARIGEIGSFTVVQRCRNSGVSQLLALAASRLACAVTNRTHTVVGVHPKAVPFYRAVWDYDLMGSARQHTHLEAPVTAMGCDVQQTLEHLRKHFRRRTPSGCLIHELVNGTVPIPATDLAEEEIRARCRRPHIPRTTFQHVFLGDEDRLTSLRPRTIRHLRSQRSDETLGFRAPRLLKVS